MFHGVGSADFLAASSTCGPRVMSPYDTNSHVMSLITVTQGLAAALHAQAGTCDAVISMPCSRGHLAVVIYIAPLRVFFCFATPVMLSAFWAASICKPCEGPIPWQ
eukprot:scaffold116009_cov18-Tisochrysis_lutea.AAC.1